MKGLSTKDIKRLFELLNEELRDQNVLGEIYLVGGAVMCLALKARAATRDVDAIFAPASQIRKAAAKVAESAGLPIGWLNDGVKGFVSSKGSFDEYIKLSNLNIFTARIDYLLAMKCLSMRIGEEFHDLNDVRYLLRYLNIESYDEAVSIIQKYYPLEQFPQKTLYALEELLGEISDQ